MTLESVAVQALSSFLSLRGPLRPLLDEEDPALDPKVVAQLTEEERKARVEAREKKEAEGKAARDEALAKEAEVVGAMDDLGKI